MDMTFESPRRLMLKSDGREKQIQAPVQIHTQIDVT